MTSAGPNPLPGPGEPSPDPLGQPSRRKGGRPFRQLFPQLFLVPLVLVVIGVFVLLFFHLIAADTRSVSEILRDMQSGGEHARRQDAYSLADIVRQRMERDPETYERFSDEQTALLLRLLDRYPEEASLREYVIKMLGQAGRPDMALPRLIAILDEPGASGADRGAAMMALGFTRSSKAVGPLLDELEGLQGPDGWVARLYGIHALVQIAAARDEVERGPIVERLRRHVDDPQPEVSWNTAYYLAFYFDDPAGIGVLRRLLDVEFLDARKGDRNRPLSDNEKQDWMAQAVEAVYAIDKELLRQEIADVRRVAMDRDWARLLNVVRVHEELLESNGAERSALGGEPRERREAGCPRAGLREIA